jgi:hypothetical protein
MKDPSFVSTMNTIRHHLYVFVLLSTLLTACQRTQEELEWAEITDFQPLNIGSSITYQLDSTIYLSNQTIKASRQHVVRFQVDAQVTDAAGRVCWRISRHLRDRQDTTRWIPDQAFLAIPDGGRLEWVEQNQRFILMVSPIREGFSWMGNKFINTLSDPQRQYLDGWNYCWKGIGLPFTSGSKIFQQTATVEMRNDSINDGRDKTRYFSKDIARDVYARNIGLIYRERIHEVWQPANTFSTTGYYEQGSYGIRMTYMSHRDSP